MRHPRRPCSSPRRLALAGSLVLASACVGDDEGHDHDHDHDHDTEIISKVELTFTPDAGGEPVVAAFTDPDGDGGVSGTADAIVLAEGTAYSLDIRLLNELADPVADITEEIRDEAETHQIFVLGDGVRGPASDAPGALVTHAYADTESDYGPDAVGDDLPVGLSNTITADTAGDARLRVVLRHLPELGGTPQKTAGLAETLAAGGDLPGDVDADVQFELSVQ